MRILSLFLYLCLTTGITGQNTQGYNLWLSYEAIGDSMVKANYSSFTSDITISRDNEVLQSAASELEQGIHKMIGIIPQLTDTLQANSHLIIAPLSALDMRFQNQISSKTAELQTDGFLIQSIEDRGENKIIITSQEDKGILYGVFRFLQFIQSEREIENISILDNPKIDLRMLNHWDNLDRSVERGYAGFSLWNWQKLPEYIDQRYIDYARANASIGINGTVLTNVNSNALVLSPMYLEKVAALADVFRKYGIKVYLTARFSAPIEIGNLDNADPLDPAVQEWWNNKASEIYNYIPDFGGFLVKANSEGQPGPQNYGRSHADGANMMATALLPHGGVVIWRAFVYSEHDPTDRHKQAYSEFVPFDGQFIENVLIQSKNGAIDFQPREPFHPMFGAMPLTPLMMESQITQKYLGFSTHLAFLPKLYEEVLQSDTYRKGQGSTVAKSISGALHPKSITGIAGVSNIGTDLNWTGHPFAQANWYGFGRLAWDPQLNADQIAEEWLRATYSGHPEFINEIKTMMLTSREAVVNYMNPLGLHHLFDTGHHYGPGPWVSELGRPEWNPIYYHKADEYGIGFNRSTSGSNAVSQYAEEVAQIFNDPKKCPEELLLWFHHLPWDYKLKNGNTLWDGLALQYQKGVDQVKTMIDTWEEASAYITEEQHKEVAMLLQIQLKEAKWWKDACLLYFQTFSKKELPAAVEKPNKSLEYYQSLKFPFAPGIRPQWD